MPWQAARARGWLPAQHEFKMLNYHSKVYALLIASTIVTSIMIVSRGGEQSGADSLTESDNRAGDHWTSDALVGRNNTVDTLRGAGREGGPSELAKISATLYSLGVSSVTVMSARVVALCHYLGWAVLFYLAGAGIIVLLLTWQRRVYRRVYNRSRPQWETPVLEHTTGVTRDPTGRVLARTVGEAVRMAMAHPLPTDANRKLAVEKCAEWVKANCPDLRRVDQPKVVARALGWVFVPLAAEIASADLIACAAVQERIHRCSSTHYIPNGGWSWWTWWTPSKTENF